MDLTRVQAEVYSILTRLRKLERNGISGTIEARDVTVDPDGNLGSTNVQAALVELQGDINTLGGLVGGGNGYFPSGWG